MNGPNPPRAADPHARPRWAAALALLWLALVVALSLTIPARLRKTGGFDTNLLSLLPDTAEDRAVSEAVQRIGGAATRKLVFLVGHPELGAAVRAADACKKELENARAWLSTLPPVDPAVLGSASEFLRPFRSGLLTAADRNALEQGGQTLVDRALTELYQPLGPPKLFSLEEDPLGLASHFLLERASGSGFSIRDGHLVVEDGGLIWVLVPAELRADALSFSAQQALAPVLREAPRVAERAGARQVLRSGFIFHAAAEATRANREMSTIGLGSMLGVILLMWLPFGSPKPVLLVLLPVAVGTLLATGIDLWVFERVHLLTMVFGSSIVGVAEDFGVHFVCGALEPGPFEPWRYLRHIARGLALALLTTIIGYLALASLPFPGLRQMGLFGAAGLFGGWITAMLWLPFLSGSLGKAKRPSIAPALVRLEARWPRLAHHRGLRVTLGLTTLVALIGLARVRTVDDVRALYDGLPELSREDAAVRTKLAIPDGARFFLVRGASDEQLLEREEALTRVLTEQRAAGRLENWQALSDSVPSPKLQRENRQLLQRVAYGAAGDSEASVARLFAALEDPEALAESRAAFAGTARTLELSRWLGSPLSAPQRHLWLGATGRAESVVLLRGVRSPESLAALARATAALPGLVLVDQFAGISKILGGFRRALSFLVPLGYAVVALCLSLFYGKQAWRVAAPAAIGSLWAIGLPALFGQQVTLFDLLALVLVLGIGIDYGIFMNEPRGAGFSVPFLSVTLGAASTLLSFGLLATSGTPALSDFGLTLLIGIASSWCLTPCFTQVPEFALVSAAGSERDA